MLLEIHHATLVHAAPGQVFTALTTSAGLDSWFTHGARVDLRPGGSILFRWIDWGPDHITAEDGGPVLTVEPDRRFVFQWHPDVPSYVTTVEIDLHPQDGGTIVRLHEYGFQDAPSGQAALASCAAGWGEALTLLKFYIEHNLRV